MRTFKIHFHNPTKGCSTYMNMLLKRLVARSIDLAIPSIAAVAAYYFAEYQGGSPFPFSVFWFSIYGLVMFSSIVITRGGTIGDLYLRIRMVSVKSGKPSVSRSLLKEFAILFVLIGVVVDVVYTAVILVLLALPVGKVIVEDEVSLVMDVLFRTKYIDDDYEDSYVASLME